MTLKEFLNKNLYNPLKFEDLRDYAQKTSKAEFLDNIKKLQTEYVNFKNYIELIIFVFVLLCAPLLSVPVLVFILIYYTWDTPLQIYLQKYNIAQVYKNVHICQKIVEYTNNYEYIQTLSPQKCLLLNRAFHEKNIDIFKYTKEDAVLVFGIPQKRSTNSIFDIWYYKNGNLEWKKDQLIQQSIKL